MKVVIGEIIKFKEGEQISGYERYKHCVCVHTGVLEEIGVLPSDLMMNGWQYFQWQIQGSKQKHLWRMFFTKDKAAEYVGHFFHGFEMAMRWVDELPGTLTPAPGTVTLNPKMRDLRKKRS